MLWHDRVDGVSVQTNLANTYGALGRDEEALRMRREVYSGTLKLYGKEDELTLTAAGNYISSLVDLRRFEEAKPLLRKMMRVARRVLGEDDDLTLRMRWNHGEVLYKDDGATLDDLREAVSSLEDTERVARRVLGGAHPLTVDIEGEMRDARAALRARESPPGSAQVS